MDAQAGIKEPDYTELDNSIAIGGLHKIFEYNRNWVNDAVAPILGDEYVSKDALKEAYYHYLKPGILDTIREAEIALLGHSLGDPDMSEDSTFLYGNILSVLLTDYSWGKTLEALEYERKLDFFGFARKWCISKPDLRLDSDYSNPVARGKLDSAMSDILGNVKREDTK